MNTELQSCSSYERDWRLNSLRFTFFSDKALTLSGATLFEDFFGLTPDAETQRKAEFLSEYTTEKGSVLYQTIIAGPKVDFIVNAALSPEKGFPVLPQEGNFEFRFSEASKNLLTKGQVHIVRVAIGAHHVQLVANKEDGYKQLSAKIPGIRLDEHSSDFQYRINRPRTVAVGGQQVVFNRLSTWGCLSIKVGIEVAGGVSSQSTVGPAVSVNTDINTALSVDVSNLSEGLKKGVIEKLFELSREIPEKGDKP